MITVDFDFVVISIKFAYHALQVQPVQLITQPYAY